MALRSGHGKHRGKGPRVEVLPPDELPAGVAVSVPVERPSDRAKGGLFARGNRLASKGALARKGTTRLSAKLGLADIESDPAFAPYKRAAADFRRTQVTALARSVGGGECGPAPASVIASAAWQLAASRFLFDNARGRTDWLKLASQLANDSRQNLLAAHELCAREAKARPAPAQSVPWLVASTEDNASEGGDDVTP
jgi:hypothetical protein